MARTWADPDHDPDYKAQLLTDATAAVAELGFKGPSAGELRHRAGPRAFRRTSWQRCSMVAMATVAAP